MHITIKSKQMEVPARVRAHIEQKLQRLARLVGQDARVEVTVTDEKTRSARERYAVHLEFSNIPYSIRAGAADVNVKTALDIALDKVTMQFSRQKARHVAAHHPPVSPIKTLALSPEGMMSDLESAEDKTTATTAEHALSAEENEQIWSRVREIRRIETKPLNEEEVIARMNEEGLPFYPFFNAETSSVNVMYRLNDGQGYGLLVPLS